MRVPMTAASVRARRHSAELSCLKDKSRSFLQVETRNTNIDRQ
jgi:hypothetical protein